LRLDAVAEGTVGAKKIGSGGQSTKWWRDGEVEKVREYCLKDVELTKKIFDYAIANSKIKYKELGKIREVSVNTAKWTQMAARPMTFTMGF